MDLKNLPSGRNFRVSVGANNFTKKLNQATRFGDLKNLRDNKDSILKALKPAERVIRLGKFGRLSQLKVMAKIKKLEGYNLTKQDKGDIKKVFAHLAGKTSERSGARSLVEKGSTKQSDEVVHDIVARRENTMSTRLSSGRVKTINRDPNNNISYNGISIQADKDPSRVIRTQQVKDSNHVTSSGLRSDSNKKPASGLSSGGSKPGQALGRLY